MRKPYLRCLSSGTKTAIGHERQTKNNNNLPEKTGRSLIEKRGKRVRFIFFLPQRMSVVLVFCFGTLFVIPACSLCYALKPVACAAVRITLFLLFLGFDCCGATQTSGFIGGCRNTTSVRRLSHLTSPLFLFHLYLFIFASGFVAWSSRREYRC